MTDDHDYLDDWLARDSKAGDIVPSSGFTEHVMAAVRDSRVAPPPIPFPWWRVAPWLVIAAVLVALTAVNVTAPSPTTSSDFELPAAWQAALQSATSPDVVWLTLGVLLSLVTMTFALRAGAWRRSM